MIKIVRAFVFPFIFLMFLWLLIGFQKHGADVLNMHLDLQQTLLSITSVNLDFSLSDVFFDTLDKLNEINSSALYSKLVHDLNLTGNTAEVVKDLLAGMRAVLPSITMIQNVITIIMALIESVLETIVFIGKFIGSILSFVFNPIFTY